MTTTATAEVTLGDLGYCPLRAAKNFRRAERRYEWGQSNKRPHWMNQLVPPLGKAIAKHKGWDGFQFGVPMGLCCRIGISFYKDGKRVFWLEVFVGEIDKGELSTTDYKEDNGMFQKGSIGYLNGMHHPNVDITPDMTLDDLLAYGVNEDANDDRKIRKEDRFWKP